MAFLGKFKGGYQDMWKAIIRPPRDEYSVSELGPKEFALRGKLYKRTDIKIKNKRGLTLECSHFEPVNRIAKELPCVIYLHGNCSSRIEALQTVDVLLPSNITMFCFDFSGCGLSEGEYISLGWYERDDVEAVIDYLRKSGNVSTIGVWGRSMGAVSAIMHADRDPSIGGMVLDSPFSDLRLLAEELVKNNSKIPKLIVSGAMALIRSTIKTKAKFDINNLVPMNHVEAGFVPALFVAAKSDAFIDQHHAKDLYEKYGGDKNIILVEGDHNSTRPKFLMDSVSIFFHNTLLVDLLPKEEINSKEELKKGDDNLSQGFKEVFLKHSMHMCEQKNIGNEEDVYDLLGEVDEEELKKALEESLRIAQENEEDKEKKGDSQEKIKDKDQGYQEECKIDDK